MEISVELMPATVAAQTPAGFGRGEPNLNPYLPPPEGRVKWVSRNSKRDRLCCQFLLLV